MKLLNRWDRSVIFELEVSTKKELVLEAIKSGANLSGADLRSADLRSADLRSADLCSADLYGADLYGANLRGADLYGANLHGANLHGADLYGADLHGARNIRSFQCGYYNRVSIAVKHETEVKFQIGCFWGNMEGAIKLIREKYGRHSHYEQLVSIYNDMLKDK